jgi:hypothetical protein
MAVQMASVLMLWFTTGMVRRNQQDNLIFPKRGLAAGHSYLRDRPTGPDVCW